MNKKIAEQLRTKKIFNEWGIAKDGHPIISVHRPSGSRDVSGHAVVLSLKGRSFKDQHWSHNGSLWFHYFSGREAEKEATQRAIEWVSQHFPAIKMVKSPFSKDAWVPEEDLNEKLLKEGATEEE